MLPEQGDSNPSSQQQNPNPPRQEIIASDGATIKDVVQAIISGKVEGDVVFGDKIYVRSEVEELNEYLDWAVAEFENRMSEILLDPARPDKPYKSLDYFSIDDVSIYFGRKAATAELFDKVVGNRVMIMYGRSGAGKSSILNAGLSPLLLREARLPVYVRIHPFEANLVQEIKQAMFPPSLKPWPKLLPDLSLHEFLGLACMRRSRRTRELVVILDQFEQFLISLPNAQIRLPFIESLRDCYEDRTLPVRFVLSVQHENLGDLDPFEQYIPLILQNRYSLPPMSEAEVKETITSPVQQIDLGISFEPELLDELFKELGGKNVELTHLQIVCSQLYSSLPKGQQVITTSLYQELGGVDKILSTYLDATLEPLPDYKHKVARIILMELVSSEGTNRILGLPDFSRVVPPDPDVLGEVLQYLVNHRLLRRGSAREEKEYELSHAYLAQEITHWIGRDALDNKRAQDLLQRELVNWRLFRILIDPEELNLLRNHLKYLSLDAEAREMILYSCLEHGHHVDFWIEQMEDRNAAARQAASSLLINKPKREQIADSLKGGLAKDLHADVLAVLLPLIDRSKSTQKGEAAETLWLLQDWLSREERFRIRWVLFPVWVRRSVQRNIWAWRVTGTAVVLPLIVFIFLVEHPVRSKWVPIQGGDFIMGMDRKEAEYANRFCLDGASKPEECDSVETLLDWSKRYPKATVKEFSILDNEVTFAQYQECVDDGACKTLSTTPEKERLTNLPVTRVTWLQAEAYCEWLGGRLPTEAEWEKAARGPKGNYFPWGSDVEHWDPELANIERKVIDTVKSIAEFEETDVSVYDVKNMAGNVQEWTATEISFAVIAGLEEPKFSNTPLSMAEAKERLPVVIVRGGSWNSARSLAFASMRRSRSIDDKLLEPSEQIGFRCACPAGVECRSPLEGLWTWLKAH